jgi:hypothetical protein
MITSYHCKLHTAAGSLRRLKELHVEVDSEGATEDDDAPTREEEAPVTEASPAEEMVEGDSESEAEGNSEGSDAFRSGTRGGLKSTTVTPTASVDSENYYGLG